MSFKIKVKETKKKESYYSMGNKDGRKYAPTRDVMPQTEVPGEQGKTGIEIAKKGMTDI